MIRAQIQLPDDVYERAKKLAEAREISLADLATTNVKDFEGFGFARVWNPIAG